MPKPSNFARRRGRPQQAPDYAARRMLASAIVITVLVVGAVVVWRAFGGGDSAGLAGADGAWNQIALINRTRGIVTTIDADGAVIAEFSGFSRILDAHVENDRVALVGPNQIYVGSFDPDAAVAATTETNRLNNTGTNADTAAGDNETTTTTDATDATDTADTTTTDTAAPGAGAGATTEPPDPTDPTEPVNVATTVTPPSLPPGFTSVTYARGSTVTRLPIANRLVLAVGQPLGGNALIVDGQSGQVIDIGALAEQPNPLLFLDTIQFDHEGTLFAIADAANFQTIVVSALPEPTLEFFPDAPLAVSDALVVTSQVVGERADVAFFKHDGTMIESISMPIPVGGVFTDRGLIVVSTEGDVSRVAGNLSTPTGLRSVERPEDSTVTRVDAVGSGSRLVVSGDNFQTVIDLDGNTIATETFEVGATAAEPQPGWACLPLGPADNVESLVALHDGSVRADVDGLALTDTSADGCTMLGDLDGDTLLVAATGRTSIGPTRSATLSPDGTTVVRVTRTSDVELISVDSEAVTEPVDLTVLTQPSALAVLYLNQ